MFLRTTLIWASFAGAPPVTCATRSYPYQRSQKNYLSEFLLVVLDFGEQFIAILLAEFDGLHSGYIVSSPPEKAVRISQIYQ